MPTDVILSPEEIATSTDRALLLQYKAQLEGYGTEPGWIEPYWVHRKAHGGIKYQRQYYRHVYRDEAGKLIRRHTAVGSLSFYRQGIHNRKKVEQIDQRLAQLDQEET